MGENRQTKRDQDGVELTGKQNNIDRLRGQCFSRIPYQQAQSVAMDKDQDKKSTFHVLLNPTDQPFTDLNAIFVLHQHM